MSPFKVVHLYTFINILFFFSSSWRTVSVCECVTSRPFSHREETSSFLIFSHFFFPRLQVSKCDSEKRLIHNWV